MDKADICIHLHKLNTHLIDMWYILPSGSVRNVCQIIAEHL